MPTVIEFLGPPGVGKTSLVPVAIEAARSSGRAAGGLTDAVYSSFKSNMRDRAFRPVFRLLPVNFARKYGKPIAARSQDRILGLREFALSYPDTMIVTLESLSRRDDLDPRQDLALGWIIELMWQYAVALRVLGDDDVLVIDEGFANRALTLFGFAFSDMDEPQLKRYVDVIPRPDLVIALSGNPEVMATRGSHTTRFGHLAHDEAVAYLRDVGRCVDATVLLLESRGVDVAAVDNRTNTTTAAHKVDVAVRTWFEESA